MERALFAANLRIACATRKSVSAICRDLTINRQQFSRYISGEALPSPHNLTRIAGYFGIRPTDFGLDETHFQRCLLSRPTAFASDPLRVGFPGNLTVLRRYLGYYQTYHLSLSWPGLVVCSCARLDERGGMVRSKSIERILDRPHEIRQHSKYVGLATYLRDRIFVIERSVSTEPMIAETILTPFEMHQRTYLKGITAGVSWRKQQMPYASRAIWRYLGSDTDHRKLLSRCGVLEPQSRQLPPTVRDFLLTDGSSTLSISDNQR
jgi:hypothetical protein